MNTPSELELANLIVNTLNLNVAANEIDPNGALFGQGLGLDSIDGLEIGMAIKKNYGIVVENSDVKTAFHSLSSLKSFIASKINEAHA